MHSRHGTCVVVSRWAPGNMVPHDASAAAHVSRRATGRMQLFPPSLPLPSVQATQDASAQGYLPRLPSMQGPGDELLQPTHDNAEALPCGEYGVLPGQLLHTLAAGDPAAMEYVPAGHGRPGGPVDPRGHT